jgi:predicted transcriptional regulator
MQTQPHGSLIRTDERILAHLHRERWATPSMMEGTDRFRATEATIAERCEQLVYSGLLERRSGDMYQLTNWGRLFVRGDGRV